MNQSDSSLLNEVDKRLTGRQWYHQRFDGAPIFLAMIAEGEVRCEERKPAGTEARWRICFFEGGKADWFLDQADIDQGAKLIVQAANQTDHWSQSLMAKWRADEAAFVSFFDELNAQDLAPLSDQELVDLFERYRQIVTTRYSSSSIIDHFALGTDRELADKLKQELAVPDGSEFYRLFSVATAPVHQSFIVQADIDLLTIAQLAQKKGIDSQPVQEALAKHQQRYFWLTNNFINATVLPLSYFEAEVQRRLAGGVDVTQEIEQLRSTPAKHKEEKAQLFHDHPLSKELRTLIEISEDFTLWQDDRKWATFYSTHMGTKILTEMARRRSIDVELLKYLGPSEVANWYLERTISADTLAARQQGCFALWEINRETIAHDEVVADIRTRILGELTAKTIQDLRGLVANTGRAIGAAKVVTSAQEIGKVNQGDILIAVMTRPDYVPAMKKAAAIVTDEGGITCHAAIVSRELGVPCIIGTKIATKAFKDGDRVEVNANHNWVRKLTDTFAKRSAQ